MTENVLSMTADQEEGAGIAPDRDKYIQVSLKHIPLECLRGLDCYVCSAKEYTLYWNKTFSLTDGDKTRLMREGVNHVYIKISCATAYYRALEAVVDRVMTNPFMDLFLRTRMLYECMRHLVATVFQNGLSQDLYARMAALAGNLSKFLVAEESAMKTLYNVMDHDEDIVTHSVNVSIYTAVISLRLKTLLRGDVTSFICGGFLHDIGMTKLPEEILSSPQNLAEEHGELFRSHVPMGLKEVRKSCPVPQIVIQAIEEHHESLDGKGYPHQLKGSKISEAGKIVAVADVLDAMTTPRSYRTHKYTLDEVLHFLNDMSYRKYYAEAVRALIGALCENICDISLAKNLQSISDTEWGGDSYDSKRRHKRHFFRLPVTIREVIKTPEGELQMGQHYDFLMNNLSRSGFGFLSNIAIQENKAVCLTVKRYNKEKDLNLLGWVIRCAQKNNNWWMIGVQFYNILEKEMVDKVRDRTPREDGRYIKGGNANISKQGS